MTVINPNSISGITSITLPAGADNVLTIHTSDGVERFRIDSSGNIKVGSAATISPDGDVFFTGVCTATTLAGSGANLTSLPSAQLSGALPALDGSALTGVASTENIRTNTNATFLQNINVSGITTVGSAVTISESGIEASGIGITCASINGAQIGGRRNLIINGAMNVAQRGTSRSATTQGVSYATVDRFQLQWNNFGVQATETVGDMGTSDTPYTLGFRKYHRITLASAGTPAAGTYIEFKYLFEAQDIANSGWNYTSPSSFVTFSFWFRCSTNQTFYTTFRTKDGTEQGYAFSFTATGNNEWTKVVRTIPGNSNLQFDNNNESGLIFYIFAANGTNYTNNNQELNEWGTFASSSYCPDMATTWLTAGASTFDLTGVQLEVGSQATAFEHRSAGEELHLCQRYYETTYDYHHLNAQNGESDRWIRFKVSKRDSPTVTTAPTNSVSFAAQNQTTEGFAGNGSGNSHANFNMEWTADAEL